ncbi:hypothetical protein RHS03_04734, partial [Rhizoctonia solani]
MSIAAEKAANAIPPPKAARGPEFLANTAPEMKPAETAFVKSFFARNWSHGQVGSMYLRMVLTPSIQHSTPEYNAPTLANPLPDRHIPRPVLLKNSDVFWRVDMLASVFSLFIGSSMANDELISEKKAPKAKPKFA